MSFSRFKFNGSSLLIWVAGLVMAFFLVSAAIDLWGYLRLEKRTIATVDKWKIIEKSSQFALRASYTFEYQGKRHQGKTTFSKPYHLNRLSAEKQIKIFSGQSWPVWFQPSHPNHSSLDRIFPFKKCIYFLMALGIFFYFNVQLSRSLYIKNL